MSDEHIPGGFILVARRTLESDLMTMTPLAFKLFFWMLLRANFRDRDKLKRGQLVTSIEELREAGAYSVGYRKERPSRDQVRSCYEALTKAIMITTAKTTRGMIVTILNYDKYQDFSHYEAHNEAHDEMHTKPHYPPHDTECIGIQERNKAPYAFSDETAGAQFPLPGPDRQGGKAKRKSAGYPEAFNSFWSLYPARNGRKSAKAEAYAAWRKALKDGQTAEALQSAIERQVEANHFRGRDGASFAPDPHRWLKHRRWEDELAGTARLSPDAEAEVDSLVATVMANYTKAAAALGTEVGGRA